MPERYKATTLQSWHTGCNTRAQNNTPGTAVLQHNFQHAAASPQSHYICWVAQSGRQDRRYVPASSDLRDAFPVPMLSYSYCANSARLLPVAHGCRPGNAESCQPSGATQTAKVATHSMTVALAVLPLHAHTQWGMPYNADWRRPSMDI
jgi:hypothetical protein